MHIYQAIETRWLGPTNFRPSRVVATTPGGHRLVMPWDYSCSVDQNHYSAAELLRLKLEWPSIKAGGATARGYAFATSLLD